jgi:tRNA 2-thiouridine synthesizing protein E
LSDSQQELITVSADEITVPGNEEGYLIDLEDWSPQLAVTLAAEEGLTLTDEHWVILIGGQTASAVALFYLA